MFWKAILNIVVERLRRRECMSEPRPNTMPKQAVDWRLFLGRWYEQARFEHAFEKGLEGCYAEYEPDPRGGLSVTNVGYDSRGNRHVARGKAIEDTGVPGGLRVSFVPMYRCFFAPYRVLMTDGETALISGEGKCYLWLLTREQVVSTSVLRPLMREAAQRGFDLKRLHITRQPWG